MTDHAKTLRKALAKYRDGKWSRDHYAEECASYDLVAEVEERLPAVLAELERLRSAMGGESTTPAGFEPGATRSLK